MRTTTTAFAAPKRLLAAAALLALLTGSAAAIDPELLWSFQANGGLESIIATPDIDGDGGIDIVFEGYGNGPSGVDHVFAVRGRSQGTAQVLWSARPIGGQSSGGGDGENCLRLGPDCNRDGRPDVLLGTAWGGRTAYSLDGATGATIWSWDTYVRTPPSPPSSGWVYATDDLGSDVNLDGVPEVVFCCGSYNDYCYCVSGADGSLVWSHDGTDAFFDVRACQDVNADGVRDVVACLGDNDVPEQVVALSGRNGTRLWSRPINYALWNVTFVSDVTGDGIAEVVPANWGNTLYCINGANGAIVWQVGAPAQQRVAALDDVNGDGYKDVAVGLNTTSACRVHSGLDGSLLWSVATSDWTWAIDRVGDCDSDGVNDVVVGDFDGYVQVLSGVNGTLVWIWRNPTQDKVLTIRGVPDLTGNGAADVVAGTQLLYNGTGGDIYALEGNPAAVSVETADPSGRFVVGNASPNPFRDRTAWEIGVAPGAQVRALLYDASGRLLRVLDASASTAGGSSAIVWDGRDARGGLMPSGAYRAVIVSGLERIAERSVVVVR